MDKFFSLFGKLVLILVVIGVVLLGGYYLGKKYTFFQANNTTVSSISPTNSALQVTSAASPTINQTQADPHVAIYGGGISPFNKYLMSGFKTWTKTVDHSSSLDKMTLTFGSYQLTILQAALGGSGCTFPGQSGSEMSVILSAPVANIVMFDGSTYKRGQADTGTNPGKATYTVCQGSGNQYSTITSFGVINYVVPLNPDTQTVAMMDAMVSSLQKQ